MFCPKCGTENPPGSKFCKTCGNPLGGGQGGPVYSSGGGGGKTSMGMEPNVAAGLSYVFWWVTGLIFFLSEKDNKFVRFHAMQSIITFAVVTVVYIIWGAIIGSIIWNLSWQLFWLVQLINALIGIAAFVLWVILIIQAFQGKYFKLPLVGDLAEKYANQ